MEEALVAQLLQAADLVTLVGDRITWNLRPQGAPLPAVVLHLVASNRRYRLRGCDGFSDAVIQIDCWGETFAAAKRTARAVAEALDGLTDPFRGPGFIEAERDDAAFNDAPSSGAPELHRTSLDVRVWRQAP